MNEFCINFRNMEPCIRLGVHVGSTCGIPLILTSLDVMSKFVDTRVKFIQHSVYRV